MRRALWRARKYRAREDVSVGCAPHWNVEHVEGFDPGLNPVAIRQPEVLRQRGVNLLKMRRDHRVAPDSAKLALGSKDERRGVVPARRRRVVGIAIARARIARTI